MEEKNYLVYSITAPTGDVFLGLCSGKFGYRMNPILYRTTSLQPYIEQFGWENLVKNVLKETIDKDEAQKFLFETACFCRANGVLINKRVAVPLNINPDRNKENQNRWRQTHKEEHNRRAKEYYWKNREKCIKRQIEYNRKKKDGISK